MRHLDKFPRSSNAVWWTLGAAAAGALLAKQARVTVPAGIEPVSNFDAARYMGNWYELARIDHRFEKGLVNTRATYSLNGDGSVRVVNRGFNPKTQTWKKSIGKAKFLGDSSVAALKVSFFGPFYGGYNVVHLGKNEETALVIGQNLNYFWLLCRERTLPARHMNELLALAAQFGVDVDKVITVPQDA